MRVIREFSTTGILINVSPGLLLENGFKGGREGGPEVSDLTGVSSLLKEESNAWNADKAESSREDEGRTVRIQFIKASVCLMDRLERLWSITRVKRSRKAWLQI